MVALNTLKDNPGARKPRTIVGRGIGSGKGKTCGSGQKGQKSRSGVAIKGFEGGQMPIYRRLPRRGFTNARRKENETVNLATVQKFIDAKKLDAGKTITPSALLEAGIITGDKDRVKLLAKGEITSKVTLELPAASKAAIAAVEKAGGKVTVAAESFTTKHRAKRLEKSASEEKKPSAKKAKKKAAKSKKQKQAA